MWTAYSTLNTCNSPATGFDSIIVIFTILGIRKSARDGLASLLRRQGIGYFGLILIVHTVTVVSTSYLFCRSSYLTAFQALVFHDRNCKRRRHASFQYGYLNCVLQHSWAFTAASLPLSSPLSWPVESCEQFSRHRYKGTFLLFVVYSHFTLFPQSQGNHKIFQLLVVGYFAIVSFSSPGGRRTVDRTDKSLTVRPSPPSTSRANLIFSVDQRWMTSMKRNPPSKSALTNLEVLPVGLPLATSED